MIVQQAAHFRFRILFIGLFLQNLLKIFKGKSLRFKDIKSTNTRNKAEISERKYVLVVGFKIFPFVFSIFSEALLLPQHGGVEQTWVIKTWKLCKKVWKGRYYLSLLFFVKTLKLVVFLVAVFCEIPSDNLTFPFRSSSTYETDSAPQAFLVFQ